MDTFDYDQDRRDQDANDEIQSDEQIANRLEEDREAYANDLRAKADYNDLIDCIDGSIERENTAFISTFEDDFRKAKPLPLEQTAERLAMDLLTGIEKTVGITVTGATYGLTVDAMTNFIMEFVNKNTAHRFGSLLLQSRDEYFARIAEREVR